MGNDYKRTILKYIPPFAVDGNFTTWEQWDNCTGTCGTGTQFRYRNCTNPAPQYDGRDCQVIYGDYNETQSCE